MRIGCVRCGKIRREIARTAKTDRGISEIERLLTTPFAVDYADDSVTLSDLRTRWEWDPPRNDPRFQKILAGAEPKTIHRRGLVIREAE